MLEEFLHRIGTFCILIGTGILILFVASDSAGTANFDYLFWALLAAIVGILLRRRRGPPGPADRFGMLHRLRRSGRGRKEHN